MRLQGSDADLLARVTGGNQTLVLLFKPSSRALKTEVKSGGLEMVQRLSMIIVGFHSFQSASAKSWRV